ncbi:hypothetical protein PV390_32670 [Streptomyces sp. ME02-6991-2A]|nr:hypothetical protein [Streptomyces sp. ME02-6991-2A]MDX3379157.1 hypothetical protein [Streptomyces sp. ME02-6991-2A]
MTVKAGQCPQDRVRRIEAYRTAGPAGQPSELPKVLDVTIDHGSSSP